MSDVDTGHLAEDADVPEEALEPGRDGTARDEDDRTEHLAEDADVSPSDIEDRRASDPRATTPPPPD